MSIYVISTKYSRINQKDHKKKRKEKDQLKTITGLFLIELQISGSSSYGCLRTLIQVGRTFQIFYP